MIKDYDVDVSVLPDKFDWTNYCLYTVKGWKLKKISYNPIWERIVYLIHADAATVPQCHDIFSPDRWFECSKQIINNRFYVYIAEKIPYRARTRDKFNEFYKTKEKKNAKIRTWLKKISEK